MVALVAVVDAEASTIHYYRVSDVLGFEAPPGLTEEERDTYEWAHYFAYCDYPSMSVGERQQWRTYADELREQYDMAYPDNMDEYGVVTHD